MARSMTGYGKAAFKNDHFEIIVEFRNLNNRYIDINLRMPKLILPHEFKVKELIKSQVIRGKLTVNISFKDLSGEAAGLSIRGQRQACRRWSGASRIFSESQNR